MGSPRRIVVIGGVAGGATAASKARRCCPDAEIEIYDQDEFISYAGCGLPYFIGGYSPNWRRLLARLPEEFETRQDIRVFLRHRVNAINPEEKSILVADLEGVSESLIAYDQLIIATGAAPIVPPLWGKDLDGVFVLRSLTHALEMKSFVDLQAPHRAAIVGGGSIGLEMCEALRRLGIEVHLVELAGQVLPPLDADLAAGVAEHLEANGVRLHLGAEVKALEARGGAVGRVVTSDGEVEVDMVLLCIGIRPSSDLAARAGIVLGARGAIRVDEYMRTNLSDVLACGDCATARHLVSGREVWIPLGSTARKQGRVAADTAAGGEGSSFPGVQGTFVLKAFDLTIGKTGLGGAEAAEAGFEAEAVTLSDRSLPDYYRGGGEMTARLTVEKGTGRLLGAQVVGDYAAVAEKRLDIFSVCVRAGFTASDLASLDLAYAPPYSPALDLPIVAGNLAEAKVLGKTCTCTPSGLE